jgi:hypothetical protein
MITLILQSTFKLRVMSTILPGKDLVIRELVLIRGYVIYIYILYILYIYIYIYDMICDMICDIYVIYIYNMICIV